MCSRYPQVRRGQAPSIRATSLGPDGESRPHSDLPGSRIIEDHQIDQELLGAPGEFHSRSNGPALLAGRIFRSLGPRPGRVGKGRSLYRGESSLRGTGAESRRLAVVKRVRRLVMDRPGGLSYLLSRTTDRKSTRL